MLARAEHGGSRDSSPYVVVSPTPGSSSIRFSSLQFRCHYSSATLTCLAVGSSWWAQLWQKIDPFSASSLCLFLPEAKKRKNSSAERASFAERIHCLLFFFLWHIISKKLLFVRIHGIRNFTGWKTRLKNVFAVSELEQVERLAYSLCGVFERCLCVWRVHAFKRYRVRLMCVR